MNGKFTPSINIIRDSHKQLEYISTPNSETVLKQMDENYSAGIHSFNIIGSYGTGKSSFLWALEKQLTGKGNLFGYSPGILNQNREYLFLKIIGDYQPINRSFFSRIGSDKDPHHLLTELDRLYLDCQQENKTLVIIVDEFGKFLEYAAKENPEEELYYIQKIAEFANDTDKDILFITALHQNVDAYTRELAPKQRVEWEKIKGRFKEITFNEPVEQLLHIASLFLKSESSCVSSKNHEKLLEVIKRSHLFPFDKQLIDQLAWQLFPMDIISAAVLTLALQKYGQNERSLFSFLKSNEYLGIKNFNRDENPYFNLGCVYDYLLNNYYSFLSTKYNPDYLQWTAINSAMERSEAIQNERYNDAAKIIKVIGLLNIFGFKGGKINPEFLFEYSQISMDIQDPKSIIESLEELKIIRYREFKQSYILFDGTDLDIGMEINRAESAIDFPADLTPMLNQYFHFPYILAKAAYFKKGTPRFFETKISSLPISISPVGEVDGIINLIFNPDIDENDIKKVSRESKEAILYALHQDSNEIRNILFEIEKISYVLKTHSDDRVVEREISILKEHLENKLNSKIIQSLYIPGIFIWIFNGENKTIEKRRDFNNLLTQICEDIYPNTPCFQNELINRHKISPSIATARTNFFQQLLEHHHKVGIDFPENRFPPEKSIYISLLERTGIHKDSFFQPPHDESFIPLWQTCEEFMSAAKKKSRLIKDLIDTLSQKPFKLKYGFIEFWIPLFLFVKRNDYALFLDDNYVPELTTELLLRVTKAPERYAIKVFDMDDLKFGLFKEYRQIAGQDEEFPVTNLSFVETIKPFFILYRNLPKYTKQTKRLSPTTLRLREAIETSKFPEKAFFEDFPRAMGFSLQDLNESHGKLEAFSHALNDALKEINDSFAQLLNRIEEFILDETGLTGLPYEEYKKNLTRRYQGIKKYLMLPHQKAFHTRLISKIGDQRIWLQSIINSVLGKPAEEMSDEDENIVFDKLKHVFRELDNLREFEIKNIDTSREEAIKIEITSLIDGLQKNTMGFPKQKLAKAEQVKNSVRKHLSDDQRTNIFALVSLLKEELKNG